MNWIILLLAGLFEVSLTFCLGKTRAASGIGFYLWGSGFLASTILSMALLAKAVQTFGDQFLTRPAFAHDQHGPVQWRGAACLFKGIEERAGLPDGFDILLHC